MFTSALLLVALGACSQGGAGGGSSLCAKAAGPLAGIVALEAKDAGSDPGIMKTFESELTAECTAQKAEETAKDALECYDKNRSAIGYRLFKSCPEEPGKALVGAVVAKHGGKRSE